MKKVIIFFVVCVLCISISGCKAEKQSQSESKYSLPFLVVDLDGDGIELIPLEQSNVYFDVDGDGLAERTAWVSPDDGFLFILSKKLDGQLEGFFDRHVIPVTSGVKQLKSDFDLNKDNIFNSEDTIPYGNFYVSPGMILIWQDKNSDGFFDEQNEKVSISYLKEKSKSQQKSEIFDLDGIMFEQVQFLYEDSNVSWKIMCQKYLQLMPGAIENQEYKQFCQNP